MKFEELNTTIHKGRGGKEVDVSTISKSYAKNLYKWYANKYKSEDVKDTLMMRTLASVAGIDQSEPLPVKVTLNSEDIYNGVVTLLSNGVGTLDEEDLLTVRKEVTELFIDNNLAKKVVKEITFRVSQ